MAVIGAELPDGLHRAALVVPVYIQQTLGDQKGNDIHLLAQPVHRHIHHVEALPEDLVAEGEAGDDLPDHADPVVFHHFF